MTRLHIYTLYGNEAIHTYIVIKLTVTPQANVSAKAGEVHTLQAWLAKHPRFHLDSTPTSSSWPNLVEMFFGQLTGTDIRRGVFHYVTDLIDAIDRYLASANTHPQPFVWTATANEIVDKGPPRTLVARCNHQLNRDALPLERDAPCGGGHELNELICVPVGAGTTVRVGSTGSAVPSTRGHGGDAHAPSTGERPPYRHLDRRR